MGIFSKVFGKKEDSPEKKELLNIYNIAVSMAKKEIKKFPDLNNKHVGNFGLDAENTYAFKGKGAIVFGYYTEYLWDLNTYSEKESQKIFDNLYSKMEELAKRLNKLAKKDKNPNIKNLIFYADKYSDAIYMNVKITSYNPSNATQEAFGIFSKIKEKWKSQDTSIHNTPENMKKAYTISTKLIKSKLPIKGGIFYPMPKEKDWVDSDTTDIWSIKTSKAIKGDIDYDKAKPYYDKINMVVDIINKEFDKDPGLSYFAVSNESDSYELCISLSFTGHKRKSAQEAMGLGAATAVPIGIRNYPFVVQYNKLMKPGFEKPAFALQDDIVSNSIITTDGKNRLVKSSSKYLNDKKVRIFKYKGKKQNGMLEVVNSLGNIVSDSFIYESISGKKMYAPDQIAFDEDFEEIDVKGFLQETQNDLSTITGKLYMINHGGLPEGRFVMTHPSNANISIFESSNGFYAMNKNTLRRTGYYQSINDIKIREDMIQ